MTAGRIRSLLAGLLVRRNYVLQKFPPALIQRPDRRLVCTLDFLLAYQSTRVEEFFFIQVGAFDGVSNDPIHDWVRRFHWRGVLLEPQPRAFEQLCQTYGDQPQLILKNAAVSDRSGEKPLYRLDDSQGDIRDDLRQLASFEREVLERHIKDSPEMMARVVATPLPCVTFGDILDEARPPSVDLLLVDAEGYDYEILKLWDFARIKPAIIQFESRHLGERVTSQAVLLLINQGYLVSLDGVDVLAYRSDLLPEPAETFETK